MSLIPEESTYCSPGSAESLTVEKVPEEMTILSPR
jgi:hypothetical protein